MKIRKQPPAALIIFSLVALLAIAGVFSLRQTTAEAGGSGMKAIAQNGSRSDVKPKEKARKTKSGKANSIAVPSNDNCAAAINVAATPFTDTKDTTGATEEASEPESTCTLQAASVWYTLTPNTNARTVTIDTCGSDFDTAVMVYKVTGAACAFAGFVPVACSDDFGGCGDGFQTQVQFLADANTTYKLQIGGFDGETGSLTTNVTWEELLCPPVVVNGKLGLGSPDYPGTSGQQTPARLFRDGVPSTCAAPKACPGPFNSGSFTYDAYTFANQSGASQCVTIDYKPNIGCGVNAHAIAYLNTFSPTNLCGNYLGDVGSSDDLPFSVTVPAGASLVVVIAANNPGGVGNGCDYQFTVVGNLCAGFDTCIQDTNNPSRFLQFSTITGKYRYRDCSKNITIEGTGTVTQSFCKIELFSTGPNPKKGDRMIHAIANPCTMRGDASISFGMVNALIGDTNIANNTCVCP